MLQSPLKHPTSTPTNPGPVAKHIHSTRFPQLEDVTNHLKWPALQAQLGAQSEIRRNTKHPPTADPPRAASGESTATPSRALSIASASEASATCVRHLSSVNAHQELCAGQGQTFGSDPFWTELIPFFTSQRSKLDGFAALRAPWVPEVQFSAKGVPNCPNCGNPCNSIHAMKPLNLVPHMCSTWPMCQ